MGIMSVEEAEDTSGGAKQDGAPSDQRKRVSNSIRTSRRKLNSTEVDHHNQDHLELLINSNSNG